jgi:single-strand DNA-binding protein
MNSYGILRFVAKPELRETSSGVKFANFSLAYNERRKDKNGDPVDTAHFLEFEIWDRGAEVLCDMFDKGDPIFIESSTPRQHTWEDKTSGQKRSKIVFRIDRFKPVPRVTVKPEVESE